MQRNRTDAKELMENLESPGGVVFASEPNAEKEVTAKEREGGRLNYESPALTAELRALIGFAIGSSGKALVLENPQTLVRLPQGGRIPLRAR